MKDETLVCDGFSGLRLRAWRDDDVDAFHAIWGDPRVIWWGPSPSLQKSAEKLAQWRQRTHGLPPPYGFFAVELPATEALPTEALPTEALPTEALPTGALPTGAIFRVIGNVMLQPTTWSAFSEVGWHFLHAVQGRGLATRAASLLLKETFARLPLDRVVAPIVPDNRASQRVAEKLGFVREGETVELAGLGHDVWVRWAG